MNTRSTHSGPFTDNRVAEWRQRIIDQGARVEPPPLHLVERYWPWLFALGVVVVAGIMEHWS